MADKYTPNLEALPTGLHNSLPLSEMFLSIQGEGRHAGCPSLFIRFLYCNLGCAWCDTRFTWDKDVIEEGSLQTVDEITDQAVNLLQSENVCKPPHIVLTGGEPMLHQQQLPSLISRLKSSGLNYFEIETNGMFVPSDEMLEAISWWNCSPKLRNNGLTPDTNLAPEALRVISKTGRADFKFVVRNRDDIEEIKSDFLPLIKREQVMLMCEGWTRKKQLANMEWLMEECKRQGFRFSPRLHILIWNNQRAR